LPLRAGEKDALASIAPETQKRIGFQLPAEVKDTA